MKKTRFNEVEINEETKQLVFNARNATAFDAPSRDSLRTADMEILPESDDGKYEYKGVKYMHHAKADMAADTLQLDDETHSFAEYLGDGYGIIIPTYAVLTEEQYDAFEPQKKLICSETFVTFEGDTTYLSDNSVEKTSAEYINEMGMIDESDHSKTTTKDATFFGLKKFAAIMSVDMQKPEYIIEVYFTE